MSLEAEAESGSDNGLKRAKVIKLFSKGGRWTVEFEGLVTRRDIVKINRVLFVEFARAQRRQSIARKRAMGLLDSKNKDKETLTVTNEIESQTNTLKELDKHDIYKP
ncbi:MAG: hypothetical protein QQN63_07470 [Nitrosopumilus sp.]